MELSGERECTECGSRWSYYETEAIRCPSCGSVRSVGVDEPAVHTASTVSFDLSAVRAQVDAEPVWAVADEAASEAGTFLGSAGFVHAGELQPLGTTHLAAAELRRVGTTLGRVRSIEDAERLYFLRLLRGADTGDRPDADRVPETLAPERALAVTATVETYLSELRRVRDGEDRPLDQVLSTIGTRRKRIEALDGAVDPDEAERLVRAVRDVSAYWREDDEAALARATERFG